MKTTVHDDPYNVKISHAGITVAHAMKCLIVEDHWWLVALEGDGDHARTCIDQVMARLRERGAAQINVDPEQLGSWDRKFYASVGFGAGPADPEERFPMERLL